VRPRGGPAVARVREDEERELLAEVAVPVAEPPRRPPLDRRPAQPGGVDPEADDERPAGEPRPPQPVDRPGERDLVTEQRVVDRDLPGAAPWSRQRVRVRAGVDEDPAAERPPARWTGQSPAIS